MSRRMISIHMKREELAKTVAYNPDLGVFTNNIEVPGVCSKGQVRMLSKRKDNSKSQPVMAIKINGFFRRATHVAYILMTGDAVPPGMGIFHKDGNKENLKWANLVLAKQSCGGKLN